MNARITAVERDALRLARAAVESRESAYGQVDAIVFALSKAGLLAGPEVGGDAITLRADGTLTSGAYVRMREALGVLHAARREHGDGMVPLVRALEAAGVLQGPENAAELVDYRVGIRELQNVLGANAQKINELEADRSVDLPALRESLREWSTRCRAEVETTRALRVRISELEALTSGQPVTKWFLAEYEGVEGSPTLHATQQSAQAWCDGLAAELGDGPWDWFPRSDEPDSGWQQWRTDPDDDRPVGRGSGSVLPLTVELAPAQAGPVFPWVQRLTTKEQIAFLDELGAASITYADTAHALEIVEERVAHWREVALAGVAADEPTAPEGVTVFLAAHVDAGMRMGYYLSRQAAMDHVHHALANEENVTVAEIQTRVIWRADDPNAVEPEWECWLHDEDGADDKPTGYTVGPIEVSAAFDPERDA